MENYGYHVTGRESSGPTEHAKYKYWAINSYFRVPDLVQADLSSGSHPEFIYSIWGKAGQGIDIGIGYGFAAAPTKWSMFAYGAVTADNTWDESTTHFDLTPGETILIAAVIDKSAPYVKLTLTRPSQSSPFATFNTQITSAAHNDLKKGARFVRETLISSNKSNNMHSNGARFKFAKWYRGTLTTMSNTYEALRGNLISSKADSGTIDRTRICTYCITETWPGDSGGFGCECATASFGPKPADAGMTGDFPCVRY